jgi:hypothetical protein
MRGRHAWGLSEARDEWAHVRNVRAGRSRSQHKPLKASAIKRFYMAGEIDHNVISIVKIDRLYNHRR